MYLMQFLVVEYYPNLPYTEYEKYQTASKYIQVSK